METKMGKSAWTKASEQRKITAIAVPFENESHVITPRSWSGMRLWVMTQQEYDSIRQKSRK